MSQLKLPRAIKELTPMHRTVLAFFAALILLPVAAGAQTVDEVIARYVQARGGMDKLKSVRTERISMKFHAGSFEADVVQINKRPDKVRQEFILQGMAQVEAYDGKAGWQLNPFEGRREAELLSEDDTKGLVLDADIDGPLVDYAQKGHKAELVGHDSVEGTDCYKIKLTLKTGDIHTYYLDTDSLMEIKEESQTMIRGAMRESETYYGDYDKVDGMYVPFAIESGQKGDPDRTKLTVEKVEFNVPVDDAVFIMPAAKH
ncbi:MAG TPA: outer membrane lipoprotein-sorting protein [Terriglobia bacterium]|jgi:outer membrane lipoprotein-sorting protein|nr:outer membrane lipoprotein-sorting protein [Terriglobia bacterium]